MDKGIVIYGKRASDGDYKAVQVDDDGVVATSGGSGGGGGAVTVANGADVTQGAIADAAYTSGSGTVVSVLKGIYTKVAAALTVKVQDGGGTALTSRTVGSARAIDAAIVDGSGNQITTFATTVADGSNVAVGAVADAAYTSGSGTVVSVLKGVYTKLAAALTVKLQDGGGTAITSRTAGSARAIDTAIVDGSGNQLASFPVTVVNGGDVTQGAIADAAYTSGSGSVIALLKGLFVGIAAGQFERWRTIASPQNLFDDGGSNPTIKNLASAALQVSNSVDNATGLYAYLGLSLLVRGASAFSSGGTIDYWILTSLDGTNFGDGSSSVTPGREPDGKFYLRAVSTAQRLEATLIAVPPCKFKVLVRNSGGQALTNTNSENALTAYCH